MILYLGTTSLMTLYARESRSDAVRDWVRAAEIVATCRIAYPEIVSALDIRFRKGDISAGDFDRAMSAFSSDWEHFVRLDFDDKEAGEFVKKYGLTRFGALHLSSAKLVLSAHEQRITTPTDHNGSRSSLTLFFSSADPVLLRAAAAEGLKVLPLA
jgi:uncharacterized protein